MNTIANILSFSRIAFIPLFVALFWVEVSYIRWVMLAIYIPVCFTDTFDGYFARTRGQVSRIGRIIDPIADKLLIASVILMLCAFDQINGLAVVAAVIIVCREIAVSGLREFMAGMKVDVPSTLVGKAKAVIQMIALGFLMVGDASPPSIPAVLIGEIVLWVAAAFSVISGYDYLKAALRQLKEHDESKLNPDRCRTDTGW